MHARHLLQCHVIISQLIQAQVFQGTHSCKSKESLFTTQRCVFEVLLPISTTLRQRRRKVLCQLQRIPTRTTISVGQLKLDGE